MGHNNAIPGLTSQYYIWIPPETRMTPRIAPIIWDDHIINIKIKLSLILLFLSLTKTAIVIAGLKCPPEIPPKISAEIVILKPIV